VLLSATFSSRAKLSEPFRSPNFQRCNKQLTSRGPFKRSSPLVYRLDSRNSVCLEHRYSLLSKKNPMRVLPIALSVRSLHAFSTSTSSSSFVAMSSVSDSLKGLTIPVPSASPTLFFRQLFEKESSTYTYLLADTLTKDAILIDPVLETVVRDSTLVTELGFTLKYCLNTHVHADHVTGSGKLKEAHPGCKSVLSAASDGEADVKLSEFGKSQHNSTTRQPTSTSSWDPLRSGSTEKSPPLSPRDRIR
jgi:hypothetical protein